MKTVNFYCVLSDGKFIFGGRYSECANFKRNASPEMKKTLSKIFVSLFNYKII